MRRGEPKRVGPALGASLAIHAVLLAFGAVASGAEPPRPRQVGYAVDIVSPPPTQLGEPMAAAPADQEPGAADPAATPAEPEPAEASEPAPAPPREDPEPEPPPRREPEKAAPAPARPPAQRPPAQRPPAATQPSRQPGTQPGTGGDTDRSRGDGNETGPTTGRNPDPNSAGGEGLSIRTGGVRCPSAGYCENIVRQVHRFFRPPESAPNGTGNLCFRIRRDGGVEQITTERVRGGAAFRLAMMEAAEQAGNRRAFGPLPAGFGTDLLPVCVELSPGT